MATTLGISRGPVREAFSAGAGRAGARGKNRGVFVRQVSVEEANEFYEVRSLEGLIGQLAARRIAIDEIEALRAVGAAHAPHAEEPQGRRILRPQRRVPRPTGARGANNALLAQYRGIVNQLDLYRRATIAHGTDPFHVHRRARGHHRNCVAARDESARRPCWASMCWPAGPACMWRWRAGAAALNPLTELPHEHDRAAVQVNGTDYRWPLRPVVVVCIDGGDPATCSSSWPTARRRTSRAACAKAMRRWPKARCRRSPARTTCRSSPARRRARHGISGNFYLDTATRQPVVMTGPELLRGDTIIAVRRRRRQGGDDHRQDKAAQAAGQAWTCARPCVLLQRICRPVHAGRERH